MLSKLICFILNCVDIVFCVPTVTVIKNPALLLCIYIGVDAGFLMTVTVIS